jgi:hypothetical protein
MIQWSLKNKFNLNTLQEIKLFGSNRIQALEWVQAQIQDIILDNITTDYPFYDDEK